MSKINKTQAEAVYNTVCRKLDKLKMDRFKEECDSFPTKYPKEYEELQEFVKYTNKAHEIMKHETKNISFPCVYSYDINNLIQNSVNKILWSKYVYPNHSEFIDDLLILGDADIMQYIENFLQKYK